MRDLREQLRAYAGEGWYPFHMPGHKRAEGSPAGPDAAIDITEIDGFDDLHHPAGILKEMQEDAARLIGSGQCRFLVNGSTAGILAAVRAAAPKGSAVLVDRRSHVSVYHAMILGELKPRYLFPETDPETGIALPPTAEDVRSALEADPDIRAVIITSPSYEGTAADVRGIAEAAHERGACLIVDEAHGAHLPFMNQCSERTALRFPESAAAAGADLAVQSLHKTMPALTQCALLHNCSDRVPQERIDAALDIFQTSSPSYVLMASVGSALRWAEERPERFAEYAERLRRLREGLAGLERVGLFGGASGNVSGEASNGASGADCDPGKIVLYDRGGAASGRELYDMLRGRLIQPEMSAGGYVVLMTSPADTDEGFERLLAAAREIDRGLRENVVPETASDERAAEAPDAYGKPFGFEAPEQVLTPAEAEEHEKEPIPAGEAEGRICGDFIYRYPPGIPLLVPGERIGAAEVRAFTAGGAEYRGVIEGKVRVIHG